MPPLPFVHPAVFLTGLAGVSVPIIIHLLNRRRYRMMDWAAMRFLWESIRRNRRRLRIEELILLAIRCGVLLVLAAALGRFTGCRAMEALPGGAESHTSVFILDDSFSMGQRVGAGSVLAAATTDLAGQLKELSRADQVAILLTSGDAGAQPFLPQTGNVEMQQLEARLAGLEPSDRRARLAETLAAAVRIFQADKATTRRLWLYGDFRRVDLAAEGEADAIKNAFDDLRELNVDLVALDFARKAGSNLSIESLEMVDKFAVAGVPTRVRLAVRNHGATTVKDVEIRLAAEVTTPQGLRQVEVPAGEIDAIARHDVGWLELQFTCPHPGPAVLTAELPADELPGDNRAYLALDAREALRVLVVDGRPDLADPFASESVFVVYGLDPDRNGSEGARVEVISPSSLAEAPLADYDLVALLDVGELPVALDANGESHYPQVEALEAFVRSGGGLAVFTGERVNPTFYNGPLYAGGAGLSPLRIGPRRGDPERREKFFRLDPTSLTAEPVLQVFRRFGAEGIDATRFIRFYALTGTLPAAAAPAPAGVKPPRVLARFTDPDNSPAIVARQFARGTVLFFYTSASMRWNDWPADENGTYVAVLHDALKYLARPPRRSLSGRVGEPIVFGLRSGLRDAMGTLKTPRHPAEPVIALSAGAGDPNAPADAAQTLRYDRAYHAGRYELELALPDGTSRQVLFARTVDPAEGDLRPGREAVLAAALGSERFTYVDRTADRPATAAETQPRKEYWTWALALLAVLLAAETYLARRFGHYPAFGSGKNSSAAETLPARPQESSRSR